MKWFISKYTKKMFGGTLLLKKCGTMQLLKHLTVSLVEEFRLYKARLFQMLRDSRDPLVKNSQLSVITGQKWKAKIAIENRVLALKMKKKIIGTVENGSVDLGLHPQLWWFKETTISKKKKKKKNVSEGIDPLEDAKHIATVRGQRKQGAWTK